MKENNAMTHSHTRSFRTAGIVVLLLLLLCSLPLFVSCGDSSGGDLVRATVTEDFKTEYFVGEAFVPVGQMKLYTEIDYYSLVPITEEMVTGFDTSHPGTIIVTVTYGDFVATVPVNVRAVKALSLTLDEVGIPDTIYENKPFPSTLTMSAVLSDGTTVKDIAVTSAMLSGFDSSIIGAQNVTVSYLGATVSFTVTIKKDVRKSIELVGSPKREYAVNEPLSVENAYLKVVYESGKTDSATLTKNLVTDFDTTMGGEFEATITYSGLTCVYEYKVIREAVSFLLTADSLPVVFEKNDPLPQTGTGVLTYNDGTTETIEHLTLDNIPAFNTLTAGEKQVEVVVLGVSDTYAYTVLPAIVSATPFGYTAAVRQDSEFDGFGGLNVVYETGAEPQSETLSLWDANAEQETSEDENGVLQTIVTDRLRVEYRTSGAGDILQKVYFRTEVITFTVHVYDETERATAVNGIAVAGTFTPIRLGDPIDVSGIQVGIDYKYLAYDVVDCMPSWVSFTMPETIEGDYEDVPVIISYLGAEAESSVRVLSTEYAAKVTSLSVWGIPTLYSVGDELSLADASAYVVYGDGYATDTLSVDAAHVSGFDASSAGKRTLTVTYGDCSFHLSYTVLSEEDKTLVTDVTVSSFTPLLFVGDTVEDIPLTYELTVTFGYGYATETLSIADEGVALTGGPFNEEGIQEVLLTCRGYEKTLQVTVHPASDKELVTAIAVLSDDVRADVGTQPDLSQVLLVVVYGHGYREELITLGSAGVVVDRTPLNGAEVGLARTTVTYEGCTCLLFVNFVSGEGGNVLQRMEAAADSKDTFTIGEEISGVELILYYKNGTERLPVTADMVPDFDTETEGEHTVTISYGGKGVLYAYTVVAAPEQQGETEEEEE